MPAVLGANCAAGVRASPHLCGVYSSRPEYLTLVGDFLRLGLRRGERLAYVTDQPDIALDTLRACDVPCDAEALDSGRVIVLSTSDVQLQGGTFDARRLARTWAAHRQDAVDAGYPALRVATDMGWASTQPGLPARVADFEANGIGTLFDSGELAAICLYGQGEFADVEPYTRAHPFTAQAGPARPEPAAWTVEADADGVLWLDGEIDHFTAEHLGVALGEFDRAGEDLVVDLSGLRFIDLAGLRAFSHAAARAASERRVILRSPPRIAERLLRLFGPAADPRLVVA